MVYAVVLFFLGALSCTTPASAASFNFETTPEGTSTPFSLSDGGLTASFSSPDGPAFFVAAAGFVSLPGRVLLDADPASHELDIGFNQNLTNISLFFALNGTAASTFTMRAFSGGLSGTQVGSVMATGIIPPGPGFPEGSVMFSGSTFNAVKLTSSAPDFAVDAINASTQVPEPGSLATFAAAMSVAAIFRARVRKTKS